MSGLREALAALHVLVDAPTGGGDRYSYCAVDGYESDDLAENPCPTLALLAAHPVEPAPVVDREPTDEMVEAVMRDMAMWDEDCSLPFFPDEPDGGRAAVRHILEAALRAGDPS